MRRRTDASECKSARFPYSCWNCRSFRSNPSSLLLLEILSFFGAKLWTRNQMAKDIVLTPSAPATPAGETAPADEGSNRSDASLEHADDAKSEAHKAEDEESRRKSERNAGKSRRNFHSRYHRTMRSRQNATMRRNRFLNRKNSNQMLPQTNQTQPRRPNSRGKRLYRRTRTKTNRLNRSFPLKMPIFNLAPSSSSADTQTTSSEPTASSTLFCSFRIRSFFDRTQGGPFSGTKNCAGSRREQLGRIRSGRCGS